MMHDQQLTGHQLSTRPGGKAGRFAARRLVAAGVVVVAVFVAVAATPTPAPTAMAAAAVTVTIDEPSTPPPTHPENQHARDGALTGPITPFADDGPEVTEPAWKDVTVVTGLEHPWGMAFLPSSDPDAGLAGVDALITERPGRLRLVMDGELHPEPLAGVPDVFAQRQGGLLDVSLHPNFGKPMAGDDSDQQTEEGRSDSETNRWVYLTYSKGNFNENGTAVGRGRLDLETHALEDFEVLFEVEPKKRNGFHFGSRMVWLPDGTLLFSTGDAGHLRDKAQDVGSYLGKMLRIRDDGSPATDNPLHARIDAVQEVYSWGHRNPQGMTIHPKTNQVWSTEHGARGGDELNLIRPGVNYGWPDATYSHEYRGPRVSEWTSLPDMLDPEAVWTPCIAPSGLTFYIGDDLEFPEWEGDLFAGGLVLRQIRKVEFNDDGTMVEGADDSTFQFEERIRDVRQGPGGYLYVLTDQPDARLFRIERAETEGEA